MIPDDNDCFHGVRERIKKLYSFLIHSNYDVDIKKYMWSITVQHLIGNHNDCIPYKPTEFVWYIGLEYENVRDKLDEILMKKVTDFDEVSPNCNTNLNEKFHKEQLIYSSKDTYYPVSQRTRDQLAVIHHNEGPIFEIELRKRLGLEDLSIKNE